MEFLRLEAEDYESALRQARERWGSAVRVHTRRDFLVRGTRRCEITLYLVDLSDRKPPFDGAAHLTYLLNLNAIPSVLTQLHDEAGDLEQSTLEVRLIEDLFSSINYSDTQLKRYVTLIGAPGSGRTSTAVKLAVHLRARLGKKVALLGIGDGIRQLASTYSLPLYNAAAQQRVEEELVQYDHIILDGSVQAPVQEDQQTQITVLSAHAQVEQMAVEYRRYHAHSVIITHLDIQGSMGQALAFLQTSGANLAFLSDGPLIPDDFHPGSSTPFIARLMGFSLELDDLSF